MRGTRRQPSRHNTFGYDGLGNGTSMGGGTSTCDLRSRLASVMPSIGVRVVASDHLGSPRLATDRCKVTCGARSTFGFGQEAYAGQSDTERMKFTGHERDLQGTPAATGDDLDYMHARYYSPSFGRFLSVDPGRDFDPKEPQSWNPFSYVRNNPINAMDPTGREVYVVTRPVRGVPIGTHSFVVVVPTKENAGIFARRLNSGGFVALGGFEGVKGRGESAGMLVKRENDGPDVATGSNRGAARQAFEVKPPSGLSLQGFERAVIQAFDSYSNSLTYSPLSPDPAGGTGNCNTLTRGIVEAAGADPAGLPGLKGIAPGWDTPVPLLKATQDPPSWMVPSHAGVAP